MWGGGPGGRGGPRGELAHDRLEREAGGPGAGATVTLASGGTDGGPDCGGYDPDCGVVPAGMFCVLSTIIIIVSTMSTQKTYAWK